MHKTQFDEEQLAELLEKYRQPPPEAEAREPTWQTLMWECIRDQISGDERYVRALELRNREMDEALAEPLSSALDKPVRLGHSLVGQVGYPFAEVPQVRYREPRWLWRPYTTREVHLPFPETEFSVNTGFFPTDRSSASANLYDGSVSLAADTSNGGAWASAGFRFHHVGFGGSYVRVMFVVQCSGIVYKDLAWPDGVEFRASCSGRATAVSILGPPFQADDEHVEERVDYPNPYVTSTTTLPGVEGVGGGGTFELTVLAGPLHRDVWITAAFAVEARRRANVPKDQRLAAKIIVGYRVMGFMFWESMTPFTESFY
jgi:hypothetical protein